MAERLPDPDDDFYAMKYTRGSWEALAEAIEQQGGMLLPEPCLGGRIDYELPQKEAVPDDPSTRCACGNETRAVIPYESIEFDKPQSGTELVSVCAVCDGVGAWPRFEGEVRRAHSKFWDNLEWEDE